MQRATAIASLGINVNWFDFGYYKDIRFLLYRFLRKFFGIELDLLGINRKVKKLLAVDRFDILWVDKGLLIKQDTLTQVKHNSRCKYLVHYSPDDMLNPGNQSRHYLQALPEYDLHVTTKSYNYHELQELGAKKVIYIQNSFDPEVHKPISLTPEERVALSCDVGFIGAYEPERAHCIKYVTSKGQPVMVRGKGWTDHKIPNLTIEDGWFADLDYSKIINATKINLAFLRKANRDLQTTRSIEIPACGGFMLAERTEEHLQLFEEGREAEFFDSAEELEEKIRFYLKHVHRRKTIAAAGRARCIRDGYDNASRLRVIIEELTAKD